MKGLCFFGLNEKFVMLQWKKVEIVELGVER